MTGVARVVNGVTLGFPQITSILASLTLLTLIPASQRALTVHTALTALPLRLKADGSSGGLERVGRSGAGGMEAKLAGG